jgi:hypothetical protein
MPNVGVHVGMPTLMRAGWYLRGSRNIPKKRGTVTVLHTHVHPRNACFNPEAYPSKEAAVAAQGEYARFLQDPTAYEQPQQQGACCAPYTVGLL